MSEYEKDKADLLKSGELMNGYKGKIVFTKRNQPGDPMHGFIAMHRESDLEWIKNDPEYLILGASPEIEVYFSDTREQEIEALNRQIEIERTDSQMRINRMLGKIQELQAIEG